MSRNVLTFEGVLLNIGGLKDDAQRHRFEEFMAKLVNNQHRELCPRCLPCEKHKRTYSAGVTARVKL